MEQYMFVDKVEVVVRAGNGGNGAVSFRQEKYVDRGGPDGGDGGRGGNVVFFADRNLNTLLNFRYKQELDAESGQSGSKRNRKGRSGEDLIVKIPVGTQVYQDGKLIADLTVADQRTIIAHGGDGGFGNAHFKSSVRQAPKVAELGEQGEGRELTLELKLLADVGLVGLPNAGKSTFLSVVTNARPEIADYPFTTLTPNLGVADLDDTSLLIADIPGLIEGASEGKGLGDAFLRHIERTAVLLHLIDIYDDDVAAAFTTIQGELAAYSPELAKRPLVVALTKIEGLPEDGVEAKKADLRKVLPKDTPLFVISSQAHAGLKELLRDLNGKVVATRAEIIESEEEIDAVPVIGLSDDQKRNAWKVTHDGGRFVVTGFKIEKFAARTNFDAEPGRRRLWDIMSKMGIMYELERQGLKEGSTVTIGRIDGHTMTFGE
jgi:GTP-binding protein